MAKQLLTWAMPGIIFVGAFMMSGACGDIIGTDDKSASDVGEAEQAEVSLEIDSRLHGCQKLAYTSLGAFLTSRGVNINAIGTPDTAGELYKNGGDTFGVPKLDSRLGEKSFHTTAGATKLFDIFLQAAPEIIANIADPAKAPDCVFNGQSFPMFDPNDNSCVYESVSCLLGRPAEDDDMTLCNIVVNKADPMSATDKQIKQRIAVATILSAGHTCE